MAEQPAQPEHPRTARPAIASDRQQAVERSKIATELRRQADAERRAGDDARAVEAHRRAGVADEREHAAKARQEARVRADQDPDERDRLADLRDGDAD